VVGDLVAGGELADAINMLGGCYGVHGWIEIILRLGMAAYITT